MPLSRPASGGGPRRLVAALVLSTIFHGVALFSILSEPWFATGSKLLPNGVALRALSVTFRRQEVVLAELREPSTGFEAPVKSGLPKVILDDDLLVDSGVPRGQQISAGGRQVVKPTGGFVPDEYLPRTKLSISARPLHDIRIPWPSFLPTIGIQSAVFTLFIDEYGTVREMVPDGHTLPPAMEEVSRKTFMSSAFSPALVDGRPVKSIQRIEVFFEYVPLPEAPEASGIVSRTELK